MTDMKDDELRAFADKLTTWELPERERELLDAMLAVVGDLRDEGEPALAFTEEFRVAFTNKKAHLILDHYSGRTHGESTIFRNTIFKGPETSHPLDHDD